ncbi:MAG: hypothetical protein ACYTAU_04895 [Planctomycetota bacterium]|jgi:hypothetical protein
MNAKRFLIFVGKVTVVLVVTTFMVGLVAYPLLTKDLFDNPDSVLARLYRTQAEPELWNAIYVWIVPVQIVRAFLIALVLYPFYDTLNGWGYWKRFISIAGLLVLLGHLAGSSGIIEGLYMMRPEFVTPEILFRSLPEPLVQGVLIAAWLAKWMAVKPQEQAQS